MKFYDPKAQPLTLREQARAWPIHRGKRLPDWVVEEMFKEYCELPSYERVGKLYGGRSARAIAFLFINRGHTPERRRSVVRPFIYDSHEWRLIDGYFSRREGPRGRQRWIRLHRVIYERWIGPIPAGHVVYFRNHNRRDVRPTNLATMPRKLWALMLLQRRGCQRKAA